MYNTVTEMHIALDMGLQHINSNRKQSISIDHKDMALNYAVLQFIELRTSPKSNRKGEGLEETYKRYDDLQELKRTYKSKVYTSGDDRVFSIFPVDYYKIISAGAYVKYSKFALPTPNTLDKVVYQILPFRDDTSTTQTYTNLVIARGSNKVFDSNTYKGLPELYGSDSKFMLINLILEEVNKVKDVDIYWEYWNDVYEKDSFIIISKDNFSIYYSSISKKPIISTPKEVNLHTYSVEGSLAVDVDLISSFNRFSFRSNYHHSRNRHLNPLATINQHRLFVEQGDNFVVTHTELEYYKKPRLISYRHNQSCELTVNREIIDLAVQKLKAYIKDEGYQHVVNENQIIE